MEDDMNAIDKIIERLLSVKGYEQNNKELYFSSI